jgi:type II secretory pathway pseudopilin PulG
MRKSHKRENGYSLVELLVATILFTIIAGSVFSLLLSAQLRYRGESNVTTAFQQANVAIDQITRDVHSAGYPPPNSFAGPPALPPDPGLVALPFSWLPSSGYPNAPCTVNASCGAFPGENDLILETDTGDGNGVQWIRYSLQGTTLMRGVVKKVGFADPVASTDGFLLPYLENVQNGNKSLAIFSYCYDGTGCGAPTGLISDIREVNVMLIVQSAQPDPQTQQFRTITLTGQAVRFN